MNPMGTFSKMCRPFCKPKWPPYNLCFSVIYIVNTSSKFLLRAGNPYNNPQNCLKLRAYCRPTYQRQCSSLRNRYNDTIVAWYTFTLYTCIRANDRNFMHLCFANRTAVATVSLVLNSECTQLRGGLWGCTL